VLRVRDTKRESALLLFYLLAWKQRARVTLYFMLTHGIEMGEERAKIFCFPKASYFIFNLSSLGMKVLLNLLYAIVGLKWLMLILH
jgi:hypothetical protein